MTNLERFWHGVEIVFKEGRKEGLTRKECLAALLSYYGDVMLLWIYDDPRTKQDTMFRAKMAFSNLMNTIDDETVEIIGGCISASADQAIK